MKVLEEKNFNEFMKKSEEPKWFIEHRENSLKKFLELDMPDFQYGLTIKVAPRNFDLSNLIINPNPKIDVKISNAEKINVVSKNKITEELLNVRPFFFEDWQNENKISSFNNAFTNNFLIIRIPKETKLEKPVLIDEDLSDTTTISYILILAEKNSDAKIYLNKNIRGVNYISDNVRVIAQPNSKVDIIRTNSFNHDAFCVDDLKAKIGSGAKVNWINIAIGGIYKKLNVSSYLNDREASSNNTVIYLTNNGQIYDIYTESIHNAQNTTSNIVTKGVVINKSKALSRGLIKISSMAQNSSGYEKQDALIFDDAEAHAIPNLEIDNNDVKCSHGSTIGKIDTDKMFYLMSKGLSENEAKKLIIIGYFTPILKNFNSGYLESEISKSISDSLK